jgi:hypothetical protein
MLRWWVCLHARGTPPDAAELRAAAERALAVPEGAVPVDAPHAPLAAAAPAAGRGDPLMEID